MSATPRLRDLERALSELPDDVVGQIVFGRLVAQPRPTLDHANAITRLSAALDPPFRSGIDGPGGWIILVEPELQLGPHVLVPDLAGWRRETMPERPSVARTEIVPDWICEVLSPSTELFDRSEKLLVYGANGVTHLWFVDPAARTVEALRSDRGRWEPIATFHDDAPARIEPFHEVELPIAWLWER